MKLAAALGPFRHAGDPPGAGGQLAALLVEAEFIGFEPSGDPIFHPLHLSVEAADLIGEHREQPRAAQQSNGILPMMTAGARDLQKRGPTRAEAGKLLDELLNDPTRRKVDANDRVYQMEASRDYDPWPHLERIQAAVFAVNFADDEVNPPELGILQREIRRVRRGRCAIVPASEQTRGHSTHSMPVFWKRHLAELLAESAR